MFTAKKKKKKKKGRKKGKKENVKHKKSDSAEKFKEVMLDPNPMSGQAHRQHVGWGWRFVPSRQSLKQNQVLKGQLLKPEEPGCVTLCIFTSLKLNFLTYKMG